MERIPLTEIEYIQSSRNYLICSTLSGQEYRLRKTMEEEEQRMKEYGFLRIHRAYLVNGIYVVQMKQNASELRLKSGKILEVGKNYRKSVAEHFMENVR